MLDTTIHERISISIEMLSCSTCDFIAHYRWVKVGQDIHRTTNQAHLPRAIHQNRSPSPRHAASPLLRLTALMMPEGGGYGVGRFKRFSEQRRNSTNRGRVQATIACRLFAERERPSISTARAQAITNTRRARRYIRLLLSLDSASTREWTVVARGQSSESRRSTIPRETLTRHSRITPRKRSTQDH